MPSFKTPLDQYQGEDKDFILMNCRGATLQVQTAVYKRHERHYKFQIKSILRKFDIYFSNIIPKLIFFNIFFKLKFDKLYPFLYKNFITIQN